MPNRPSQRARAEATEALGTTPDIGEEGLDPGRLWGLLYGNRGMVVTVGAVFALAVGAITLASPMEFRSSGRLYLGELEGKARSAAARPGELDFVSAESADLASEIQLLQSASILQSAILSSGANVRVRPVDWEPPRYWRWRLERRNPAMLDRGLRQLTPSNVSLSDESRGVQDFSVKFTSDTDYEIWANDEKLATGKLGEVVDAKRVKLTLSEGTESHPVTGDAFVLSVTPMDVALRDTAKHLSIGFPKAATQGELIRVISLDYTDNSPLLASRLLRGLMDRYLEQRRAWKTEDASAAEAFIANQLKVVRESLDKTERHLTDFRTTHSAVALDNEARAMIEQIGKYEEQRVAARLQLASLADLKRALRDPSARVESFLASAATDPVLEGLAKSLSEAREDLTSLQERFSEAAPDVRQRRAEVESQLDMIRNYVTTRHARAQENLSALSQIISQFEERLKGVPGAELGLTQLARESEVYSKMYSYLLERQQQAAIIKASTVSKNRILDVPQVPYREASPLVLVRLGVALLGLVLGVAAVLLRRVFSSTLQSEADVQSLAADMPIYTTVPSIVARPARGKELPAIALLADPTSPFAESFRMLRANLYHASGRSQGLVVLLTSPTPGDGKSTSAVALSTMLAADGKNVLLVDADVRKPSHHTIFRQALEPGLNNALRGDCEWLSATRCVSAAQQDFYAMTAGSAAAPELLSGEAMAAFLHEARTRYDVIVIDAASFPLVSDALVLAAHADCVLSVLRLQHTPRPLALRHLRGLAEHAGVLGVVINSGIAHQGYGPKTGYPGRRGRVAPTTQPSVAQGAPG